MAKARTASGVKALRAALWGFVLLAGVATTWLFLIASPPGAPQETAALGQGAYRLETTLGTPFTAESLQGQPALVFFGFTHCPDICPTTMGEIALWQEELGPLADGLRVWLITVDPERDTVDALRDYVSWLPNAAGVTGAPAEVEKAFAAFRITARRVDLGAGDYSMDHSAPVLLFDANGRYRAAFGYQEDAAKVLAKLRPVLEGAT
ncbi:SCO family protein [Gemmobacter serpentinus]|uniref:SCO family protein n=1 Tax=Gemmobacter serpentinus TaxID=2652247 RepID=UPI001CF6D9EB|nr:SCO family protein [Gemmobacter serpentinus]